MRCAERKEYECGFFFFIEAPTFAVYLKGSAHEREREKKRARTKEKKSQSV
jgi:hypothetical protein